MLFLSHVTQVIAWKTQKPTHQLQSNSKHHTEHRIFTFQPETKIIERLYKIHIICAFNPFVYDDKLNTFSSHFAWLTHSLRLTWFAIKTLSAQCNSVCVYEFLFLSINISSLSLDEGSGSSEIVLVKSTKMILYLTMLQPWTKLIGKVTNQKWKKNYK